MSDIKTSKLISLSNQGELIKDIQKLMNKQKIKSIFNISCRGVKT